MRVPGYLFPEAAARALAGSARLAGFRARAPGRSPAFPDIRADECRRIVDDAFARFGPSGGWLDASATQQLLTAVDLRVPQWKLVHTPDEAVAIASRWKCPLALKVVSPTVSHKTDVGGVLLDIRGEPGVRAAFSHVLQSAPDASGVLLQEFLPEGQETFIGALRDSQFGHLVTFGVGGVLVELLRDVVCRMHPLTDQDAHEMVGAIRAAPLLFGFRGSKAVDIPALEEALLRTSILLTVIPEISELDLNPVKALPVGNGVRVIDARIRIAS
jgi:acyl-CoA synthetase (NDP forming)